MDCVQVADGIFHATGTDVNWFLLKDGDDLTLIDGGYPGDLEGVLGSIAIAGGRPQDVRAILLTHAHIDHMGAINHFHATYGTPVYMDPVEVAHARREHLEQAGPLDVVKQSWRPGVLPWSLRIMRAGATQKVAIAHAEAFPDAGALDLPGSPVPVATHGHTSGHTAYFVPGAGAVATGDGLVTAHAVSRRTGPQLIPGWFDHSPLDPVAALDPLAELDADLILPGHGPALRVPLADAVATARATR